MPVCFLLSVGAASAQNYSLTWDPNADPFTVGYRVYGGTQPGDYPWTIDVGRATTASLPLVPGNTYYFVVRAYNANGEFGPPSDVASIDVGPPGPPTAVSATSEGSRVTMSWSPPGEGPAASQYVIFAGTAPGSSNLVHAYPVGTERTVSGDLGPGIYYARVQASNRHGVGPPSAEISFVVGGPGQPGSPSGLAASWQGTVVTLTWNPAYGAASYLIEAGSVSGAVNLANIAVGGSTSYSVDPPPGTYFVRVRAVNGAGVSAPSNEIIVRR